MTTFEEKLLRAKQGDRESIEFVLRDVQSPLAEFVQQEFGDTRDCPIDSTDILQTVFAEAWMNLPCCRAGERVGLIGWLKSIAKSRMLDALRHWRAERRGGKNPPLGESGQDSRLGLLQEFVTNGLPGPRTGVEKVELGAVLRDIVADLPQAYRDVVQRHYFQGSSAIDAAEALQISEGAVYMRLSRARHLIMDELQRRMGTANITF